MKFIAIILFLFSVDVQARQYIQCADDNSWDRIVVNLDGDASTLFMVNGVHLPDDVRIEVLKDLFLFEVNPTTTTFRTNEGPIIETIEIPNTVLGKALGNFSVILKQLDTQDGYQIERVLGCFSSIH